jgi:hypothetical protein
MSEPSFKPDRLKWRIVPSFDFDSETLRFDTFLNDATTAISREIASFKDKTVRETLIKLGWTPPKE